MTTYTFGQLENLWKQAGGNPIYAPMAAAIAMAESGGNSSSVNHNGNGTTDRGLWQINSIHGALSTFDPFANAKAAVNISQNGTTWRPWCTAWSNAHCGGTYLGNGAPYQKFLSSSVPTGPTPPSATTPTPVQTVSDPFGLNSAIDHLFGRISTGAVAVVYGMIGILMMLVGVFILVKELTGKKPPSGKTIVNIVRQGSKRKTISKAENTGINDTGSDDE